MRIIYTKHALTKLTELERLGWKITQVRVEETIKDPKWKGVSNFGQETAMSIIDSRHILRVIFNRKGDIIKIVTIHLTRKGRYESTI